jgi:hypothetical protein
LQASGFGIELLGLVAVRVGDRAELAARAERGERVKLSL